MRPEKIDVLINDVELNMLADLFLARYGFDTSSAQYRQLRNAIVAFSHGTSLTVADILYHIADCDGVSYNSLVSGLENALRKLPRHVFQTYNDVYAPPSSDGRRVRMKPRGDLKYIIAFLGTVFMYLTDVNHKRAVRVNATELRRTAALLKKSK